MAKLKMSDVIARTGYSESGIRKMIKEDRLIGRYFERNALGKLVIDEKHLDEVTQ